MILHGYFRSSASYRVRIALNLKGMAYETRSYDLLRDGQRSPHYLALNPQGRVPALELGDGTILTQSLAICEYLDEIQPDPPLLSEDPLQRARIRAFSQIIACDIQPVQNIGVLRRLKQLTGNAQDSTDWARETIETGLQACEALISRESGPFCFGAAPTLADICLVGILANARRHGAKPAVPRLLEVENVCLALDAFRRAMPENQPDAA